MKFFWKKSKMIAAAVAAVLLAGCGGGEEGKEDSKVQEATGTDVGQSEKVGKSYTQEEIRDIAASMVYPVLEVEEESVTKEPLAENCQISKKGMQLNELMVEDAIDLGIGCGFINFYFNELISSVPTKYEYVYKGVTYYLTEESLETCDYMISRMSEEKIRVIAAVVNGYNEDFPQMRYPEIGYHPGTQYYAFNVVTQEGKDLLEGMMEFLLERYSGGEHGVVSDWVIGNEVNDNLQYNYIGPCDGETYVAEYYRQFQFFYNIIRKYDEDCGIYIPMEHRWNTANTMTDYGGKWFLEYFHACELADQQMDWGLAWHPYPYPLGDADTLDDGDEPTTDTDGQPTYGGEVTMEYTSPLVSMKNIHVITDFLSENLLTQDGEVRSIICSEVGYTSYSVLVGDNESKQAANIAYAYNKAQMNPYIDAFIIRCQLDVNEGSPYFQFGLREDAEEKYLSEKLAFQVFKYMDTTRAEEFTRDCLPVLGLKEWTDVIENYDASVFEGMTEYEEGILYRAGQAGIAAAKAQEKVRTLSAGKDLNYDDLMYDCFFLDMEESESRSSNIVGFVLESSSEADASIKARIRVKSGIHVFEATGVFEPEKTEVLLADLSGWNYADHIDCAELWLSDAETELNPDTSYRAEGFWTKTDAADLQECEVMELPEKVRKSVEELTYSEIPDVPYSGTHIRPEVTVTDGEKVLLDDVDYCLSYANDKAAGTAYAVVQGLGDYIGTHVIEYRIVSDYGDVFDPVYYLANNQDVAELYGDDPVMAQQHFIANGMAEGRQGCKDFSPYYYMENYPDLREAYGEELILYYLHYIHVGKQEGRIANRMLNNASYMGVDYTEVYDAAYYAQHRWDLFESFKKNEYFLLRYFVEEGMAAGERGSEEFDVLQYKDANSELRKKFKNDLKAYYMYYLEEGFANGDSGTPNEDAVWNPEEPLVYRGKDLSDVYDPVYYAAMYDDTGAISDDPEALIRHFAVYGRKEGRRGNYEFDPKLYMARYADVRDAFGNIVELTYDNYIEFGKEAGR